MAFRAFTAVIRNREILMVRHIHDGKDYWTLPGGKIEDGEDEWEAATREVLEETGIQVRILKRLYEEKGQVCFLGSCADDAQETVGYDPELPEGEQWISDVRWFSLGDMRDDLQVSKVIRALPADLEEHGY